MCMNSRADTVMTDETVVALFETQVLETLERVAPVADTYAIWLGFVIGVERYDLANGAGYARFGAPVVMQRATEADTRERLKQVLERKSRF